MQKKKLNFGVWVQYWEESERGWGVRPDGCWLYPTKEEAKKDTAERIKKSYERDKELYPAVANGIVPEIYDRPSGEPIFELVSRAVANKVRKHGKLWMQKFDSGISGIKE